MSHGWGMYFHLSYHARGQLKALLEPDKKHNQQEITTMSLRNPVVQPINFEPIVHEDLSNPLYSADPSTSCSSDGRSSLGYDKTQVAHPDKVAETNSLQARPEGSRKYSKRPERAEYLKFLKMFNPPEARERRAVRKNFIENEIQDKTERDGLVHYRRVMSSSQGIIRRKEGSAMETGTECERDQYRFEMENYAVW
ncbi:hypothetical protein LOZ57_005572 [Ophidiomyces ophidiicola]|uniref:uncharacterized protein n=1 Tax=Ophidiomyces ophidiicola TaxID=1387563 RepID=UPI0020C1E9DA|nr:uncharacterized protein LOZ57_005572 [Ophidiomyces ophidiicola]KAI1941587.1 hypothetical protein LOZ57_005572 [Ophidiomyces ophidiicola]